MTFSEKIDGLPSELLGRWSKLAYVQITSGNLFQLDEVIQLVEQPMLPVCHKEQMLRVLKSLRALVHTIPEVEEKAAKILQSLRYGSWAEDEYRSRFSTFSKWSPMENWEWSLTD